ncbi:hypothetical protein V8J88_05140 [Massilia sp. W12]|uniref:hypothetical protein n=1 Tax=Massilia sp. W12 TaxID=3126507 RepID=UPI0030D1FB39
MNDLRLQLALTPADTLRTLAEKIISCGFLQFSSSYPVQTAYAQEQPILRIQADLTDAAGKTCVEFLIAPTTLLSACLPDMQLAFRLQKHADAAQTPSASLSQEQAIARARQFAAGLPSHGIPLKTEALSVRFCQADALSRTLGLPGAHWAVMFAYDTPQDMVMSPDEVLILLDAVSGKAVLATLM